MLVIHNDAGSGGRIGRIETKPFRRYAFGSLLNYVDEVHQRNFKQKLLECHSLALPGGVAVYDKEQLQQTVVNEKYDSVMCHLVLDHGGILSDDLFLILRKEFLKENGVLLNPVKSIAKNEVARASQFELETQTAPCVIKKNDNYNEPGTVLQMSTQAELDAWLEKTPPEERAQLVVHKLLGYYGTAQSKMYQLERWIVLFDDLTVNHRCSDEFYIKSGTSLSYYVRDERQMASDLGHLAQSGYNWKGRSIDCAYDNDSEAWDARYAVLKQCRDAFHFDYVELDVMRPAKNEFVVIDVNQTPGPSYKNRHFRELAVQLFSDALGLSPELDQESDLDPQVIEEQLARNPNDAALRFQLARRYQALGQLQPALTTYKQRASLDHGSEEERYVAQLEVGRISVQLKAAEPVVLGELLGAYMLRPRRAEPLYELACYFRSRNNAAMATLFAKAGVQTPRPDDQLAVVDSIYTWQLLDELGQAAQLAGDFASAKDAWEIVLKRVQAGLALPPDQLARIRKDLAQIAKSLSG